MRFKRKTLLFNKLNIEIHELRQKESEREDDGKKTRNEDALKISIDNAQQ